MLAVRSPSWTFIWQPKLLTLQVLGELVGFMGVGALAALG